VFVEGAIGAVDVYGISAADAADAMGYVNVYECIVRGEAREKLAKA